MTANEYIKVRFGRHMDQCTNEEIYVGLLEYVKDQAKNKEIAGGKKKLYYISAEFLIGKLLSNNLINLGIYDEVKAELDACGKSLAEIEEIEVEPSLGNGGLGRLAACFLDSIATLGLNGDGVGLAYHMGLFKQVFRNNLQNEEPNPWMSEHSWMTRTDKTYKIDFGGFNVTSRMYDIDVTGYDSVTTKLHLFDVDTVDESIIHDGINFDKSEFTKNLTLFLYPDDSDDNGRLLRVYQQYFMVSNAAQLILDEAVEKGSNLYDLSDYAVIQINDTHPSMVIPELIRLLQIRGLTIDEAIDVVSKCTAYTNHTILAEALEKWPIHFMMKAVPQLLPIIRELHNRVHKKYNNPDVDIIRDGLVHMAHMDIHYGISINGVAALHTEILKDTELNAFYKLYPEKFNNKTNGITFRRWLLYSNPELSKLIEELIGPGFKKDATELKKLEQYMSDDAVVQRFLDVKNCRKTVLKNYLAKTQGIEIDDNSVYDIQIKRLHEYKRQLLNILHVMYLYNKIKANPGMDFYPRTFIFGAKAAAGYRTAKLTIKLINSVAEVINNDESIEGKLKVVFIEDYRVSNAEIIVSAADVSEQISTASKEASGTGNMKFMLNGALTIGTMDGANVEMAEEVGKDNMFIFGLSADEVIEYEKNGGYNPMDIFNNDRDVRDVLTQLVNGFYAKDDPDMFRDLYNSLLNTKSTSKADTYFILKDFRSYADAQEKVEKEYRDADLWAKKAILNTAAAGKFSSDRTIREYVDEIWHLDQVTLPKKPGKK